MGDGVVIEVFRFDLFPFRQGGRMECKESQSMPCEELLETAG
jgi:hypothetical protein